jgi:glycosyltransferase involved in cell wall biosynthesis
MQKLRLVVPAFNDWDALGILLRELDRVASMLPVQIDVSAVDDGSTLYAPADLCQSADLQHIGSVEIVSLRTNLGHQRAIAVGLCIAVEDGDCDAVLVMDADGEDSPAAVRQLLEAAGQATDFCVVAQRGKRSEGPVFRAFYLLYRLFFFLLTGHGISFGNFCLISRSYARRLVSVSDLWNNLPAAVLHSRLPIKAVSVDRARRYAGKSKMNITQLIVHGLSGLSVYADTIFIRLLILTFGLFFLSGVSIPLVLILRIFFPRYATPGWATTVSFGISTILVQTLSFTLLFVIMLLSNRVQRLIIPFVDYKHFVDVRRVVFSRGSHGA